MMPFKDLRFGHVEKERDTVDVILWKAMPSFPPTFKTFPFLIFSR